jgi:hypothetical protein
LEIGLGQAEGIERVVITWPAPGSTQELTGLEMDRLYRVKEGEPGAVVWALNSFKLGNPGAAGAHGHAR